MADCVNILLKEHRDGWKRWLTEGSCDGVEISSKKVTSDNHPLKLWRSWVDIDAPPAELMNRLINERELWDDDVIKMSRVCVLTEDADIVHYVLNDMPPHPTRDYCLLRVWQRDMIELRGGGVLVETSVTHQSVPLLGGVRAFCLASRYLVEPSPLGGGRTRLTYVARIDTKGRGKAWYNHIFGHICSRQIARLRDSFRNDMSTQQGPETKV